MEEKDVIDLYDLFEKNDIDIWVDGGWGVDALLGEQTRPHADLDIAIERKNVAKLRELLKDYQIKQTDDLSDWNFVLKNSQGLEVDVHVFEFDDKRNNIYGVKYPYESLTGTGQIGGIVVKCISPEWTIKFHSGYKLKEKDFQDVSALCKRFNIELPEEYVKFKNEN